MLYIGPAEPDKPLPMEYLAHAQITAGPERPYLTCQRCEKVWAEHQWVLFGPGWQELDCSIRRRDSQ
jgi:hypothetical protein